jgi:DNA-binding CsgD family transcriptional regulator
VIAYRIAPSAPQRNDDVVLSRQQRIRVIVIDRGLRIVAAQSDARRMLVEIEPAATDRLPSAIAALVREWLAGGARTDMRGAVAGRYIVMAMCLEGFPELIALVLEPVSTREHLRVAAARFGLSRREVDVLRLLLEGDSAYEVAQRLEIAESTVGDYIKRIFAKTRVRNRSEMIAKCLGWHLGESS